MQLNSLKNYRKDRVKYRIEGENFVHNFAEDYHILLVQREQFAKVRNQLKLHCKIIKEYDLLWTKDYIIENKQRLSVGLCSLSELNETTDLQLRAVIVKLDTVSYRLNEAGVYNVNWPSKDYSELCNNIILSSNNIESFFLFSSLLLGAEFVNDDGDIANIANVKNLAGTEGWKSFNEMFTVANYCSDWLVLRNAEYLPHNFWGNDKDIDILCDKLPQFLSAINAQKKSNGIANFEVTIQSIKVDVDARFVGDDYYDRTWQEDMLATKNYQGLVPQLNIEHYFYSLLYHARIHKSIVKSIYVPRLRQMAKAIMLNFDEKILFDDQSCAQFFDEYFNLKGYKLTYPQDYACYENINRKVSRHVTHVKAMPFNADFTWRLLKNRVFLGLCKILPRSLKDNLKRVLNR